MVYFYHALVFLIGCCGFLYWRASKMAKAGSPLFKIGYYLYTRTRLGYYYYKRDVNKAKVKYASGHSVVTPEETNGLRILPIPLSLDNYSYLIIDVSTQSAVIVDPADPDIVQGILDEENVNLSAILTTHKHWDHSGGNKYFRTKYSNIKIYGSSMDHVPDVTNTSFDGDIITIPNTKLTFKVLHTPGHTVGHLVYVLDGEPYSAPSSLFSGDLVFLGGCGRMFEGAASVMLSSLDKICDLPDSTLVWPGHEYSLDNLQFALTVDPDNETLQQKVLWATTQRKDRLCTSPSTLEEEKQYNPFLRTNNPSIVDNLGLEDQYKEDELRGRAAALQELRARKDKFKYKL